jgi:AcrR family transcriptional regulator
VRGSVSSGKCGLSEVARHIARAAARLFATGGYDATPVRTIVEAAGVTKPTLYYHFGSKEGLAKAVLLLPMAGLAEAMQSILDSEKDPVVALVRMVEAHFVFCREDPECARFFFALWFGPQGTELLVEIKQSMGELPELLTRGIRRLAEAGLIAPERIGACATACRGMIVIAMMDYIYRDRHPPCEHEMFESRGELGAGLADRLVGDLLHGFALPGAKG